MTSQDGPEHGRENGDARPVIEETFALQDRGESRGCSQLAKNVHDGYGVGGSDDRTEKHPAGPVEAQADMRQCTDRSHGQEDAECRK